MDAPDQKSFAAAIRLELAKSLTPLESWLKELEAKLDSITQASSRRLLRAKAVSQKVGLPIPSIYELIARDQFPKPINLSKRRVAWIEADLDRWIDSRIEASRQSTPREVQRRRLRGEE
jgi:prophage regulatory protein